MQETGRFKTITKAAGCQSARLALLIAPATRSGIVDDVRGGVGVVTIDGPIRELTLDVVDICRKGITSPSRQNGICFRTSLPFAQPRLLLLLCQPTFGL